MSSPAARDDGRVGYAQPADIRQALYYVTLLDELRKCLRTELGADRLLLAAHFAAHDLNRIRSLRSAIRRQETELRVLDSIIDALNDRLDRSR
jgi:hypothetical protein